MGDGWGLATDGKFLFGTDGSSTLYQIDPLNMKGFSKTLILLFSAWICVGVVLGKGGVLNRWCIYVLLVKSVYSIEVKILVHLRHHCFYVIYLNSCWIILLYPGYLPLPFLFLLHVIAKAVIQKQVVTYNGYEVHNLNELEYINDEVWANVWQVTTLFILVH